MIAERFHGFKKFTGGNNESPGFRFLPVPR
jgi:hypothetical protein